MSQQNLHLEIFRATSAHVKTISELGAVTFYDTFAGTCTKADIKYILELYFNDQQVMQELCDPNDYFYIANVDGKAAGYFRMNAYDACPVNDVLLPAIELKRIYVLKEFHGSKVAQELMNCAFRQAKELEYNTIYLSVWEYNFRARGFYERNGFINTGIKNDFPLGSTPQTDYWFIKTL